MVKLITHVPIDKGALEALSSASLTAMSNYLTEKASNVQSDMKTLERKIQMERIHTNLVSEDTKSVGPVIAELNTMSLADESGMTKEDLFTQGVPSIGIASIVEILTNQFPDDAGNTKFSSSTKLQGFLSDKGSSNVTFQLLNSDLDKIAAIIKARIANPSLEPTIDYTALEASAGSLGLSDNDLSIVATHKDFIATKIVTPLKDSKIAVDSFALQLSGRNSGEGEDLFDLVYGPPISTKGQYVLSQDGMYYDSRGGGIPQVALADILFDSWNLNDAPNKGGKGIKYDEFDLIEYSNTVFSPEFIDVNDTVLKLIDTDDILQGIEDDRSSHVNIASGQISDLVASGYDVSSAMVTNYKRSLAALSDSYEREKVKRLKQLQLAGLYGNFSITTNEFPLGAGYILEPVLDESGDIYKVGVTVQGWSLPIEGIATKLLDDKVSVFQILPRIPVNDFSFLNGTGVQPRIDTQKKYLLQSADVNDIIKPYQVRFTKSDRPGAIFLNDFTVSPPGTGDFVHINGDPNVSSVRPYVKSLTDDIVTDNLVVCYNFLKGAVESPSSTGYILDNEADSSPALNGKLVATSVSSLFPSGISIPYLGGTLFDADASEAPEPWYNNVPKGSYVRLPNNVKDGAVNRGSSPIDDITYGIEGFSVESWLHIPDLLTGMDEGHQYRLLLSCENTGHGGGDVVMANMNSNAEGLIEKDFLKVHGLSLGFRLKDNYVSGVPDVSSLEFGVFPTVSQNSLKGTWGSSAAIAESISGLDPISSSKEQLGFSFDASTVTPSNESLLNCSGEFIHVETIFNYRSDEVSVLLDKVLLVSGVLSQAFQTNPGSPLQVPSPVTYIEGLEGVYLNSHGVSNGSLYVESVHEGSEVPPPGIQILTPWIIGGGFTDSIGRSLSLEANVGATTPLGFLGSNTNDSYYTSSLDASGSVTGQHDPSLGGMLYNLVDRKIQRSGLDGFVGSFKIYSKPLNTKEVGQNYDAQQAFFKNIKT